MSPRHLEVLPHQDLQKLRTFLGKGRLPGTPLLPEQELRIIQTLGHGPALEAGSWWSALPTKTLMSTALIMLGAAVPLFTYWGIHQPEALIQEAALAVPPKTDSAAQHPSRPADRPREAQTDPGAYMNVAPPGFESTVDNIQPRNTPSYIEEARLLARALQQLRQKNNPSAELKMLDQHRIQYPASTLTQEIQTARVEAYIKLGQDEPALQILHQLEAEPAGRHVLGQQRILLLLRGELQARQGQCVNAIQVFDSILSTVDVERSHRERALWGRALCRLKMDQPALAKSDIYEYLKIFPSGRFATDARQLSNDL